MDDLVRVEVAQRGGQLPREVEVGLEGRRAEVFVEVFQGARDVLHEDAGLFLQVVVLDVPDYIFMVDFGQDCDLHFALFLVLLAEMYLLHCGEHSVVDVECLVDPAGAASSDHLADLPFLYALLAADQVVLHDALLALLQQQGDALHYRDAFPSSAVRAVFQDLCLDLVVRFHEDGVHVGDEVF